MRTIHLSMVLSLCCALVACDDESPVAPLGTPRQPIVLDEQVVFVDPELKQAFLLDLEASRPKAETVSYNLPPQANVGAARLGDHNEALILCSGERESVDTEAAQAALVVIAGDGKRREYELGTTAFNTLTQSEDGRYAIAYRVGSTQGRTLDNPNELIVIDLDKDPDADGAVTRKTPAGLGHTLTRVLVSPSMTIADEDRRLLVLLSAAEVSIFDLNHLDRRATIVQLDDRGNIDPFQVLFSTDQPTLYVRGTGSDNVFMFRFEPYENDEEGNDFQPSINPLSAGGVPQDMALFGSGSAERLLVLANDRALVVDPATSKTEIVPLGVSANRILLFDGRSPHEDRSQKHALLYATSENRFVFLDLEVMGDTPSDSVEAIGTEQPIQSLIPLIDGDEKSVVLLQQSLVTVVDLEMRTLTPISTSTQLTAAVFDSVRKKLWVGQAGSPYIQSLELATGRTGDELRLDASIKSLLPMFKRDRLLVLHEESLGYVTLVDAEQPDREHALSLRGFFVNQLFDRSDR
ncbi:MAG TPA: hypothetical protein VFN67_29455 [Polyangiales bacterium]|nr:hypothetical protein [Polyangiales bacterium]